MAPGRKQKHFDFFFDQLKKKSKDTTSGAAKKDGQTGIVFLAEMLDPQNSPNKDGVSLFKTYYPDTTHILLSGDTGNGYRAYAMLEELSTLFAKYGYTVELLPLAPGHAWNRTDARIAHMNTFLGVLKAVSRVFMASGVARAFHAASDPSLANRRKYMYRSHVFYRAVVVDAEKAAADKKVLGGHVISTTLDKGHMGVRGFLYFNFSVKGAGGEACHPTGYALVRQFADPNRVDNRSYVYSWRKDLLSLMCQQCSNVFGGPVALTVSGCTKKSCSVERKQKSDAERDPMLVPRMPVERASLADIAQDAVLLGSDSGLDENEDVHGLENASGRGHGRRENARVGRGRLRAEPPTTVTSQVSRQVRAVHGTQEGNKPELWLYIPEHLGDKDKSRRKGWWLHAQPEMKGHYYIGQLEVVQRYKAKNMVKDVACFNDFPFNRSVQVDATGREMTKTLRCITARTLDENELSEARNGEDIAEPNDADADMPYKPNMEQGRNKNDGGDAYNEFDEGDGDDSDDYYVDRGESNDVRRQHRKRGLRPSAPVQALPVKNVRRSARSKT